MSFLSHLWYSFLALHPWGYVITAAITLVVFIKGKAIGAAAAAAWKPIKEKFFSWLSKNLPGQKPANEKTYKGIFMGFFQYSNPPHEWFFTLVENGTEYKVPTMRSNLLSGVQQGTFTEIDTQVLPGAKVEVIRRVRVRPKATKTT
jgi:hypothetical protein